MALAKKKQKNNERTIHRTFNIKTALSLKINVYLKRQKAAHAIGFKTTRPKRKEGKQKRKILSTSWQISEEKHKNNKQMANAILEFSETK